MSLWVNAFIIILSRRTSGSAKLGVINPVLVSIGSVVYIRPVGVIGSPSSTAGFGTITASRIPAVPGITKAQSTTDPGRGYSMKELLDEIYDAAKAIQGEHPRNSPSWILARLICLCVSEIKESLDESR